MEWIIVENLNWDQRISLSLLVVYLAFTLMVCVQ